MGTHTVSMTAVASEQIAQYSIVKIDAGEEVDGLPKVVNCNSSLDVIFGVALSDAAAGDRVAIRFPFSGLLPANCYKGGGQTGVHSGDGLTIGLGIPGSLSNNDSSTYDRKVAYIVQCRKTDDYSGVVRGIVVFVRAQFKIS